MKNHEPSAPSFFFLAKGGKLSPFVPAPKELLASPQVLDAVNNYVYS
jgi:hypothetical protein